MRAVREAHLRVSGLCHVVRPAHFERAKYLGTVPADVLALLLERWYVLYITGRVI